MSDSPKKFYLTTPIYYVNARPHIGHAYTTIVADVIARRHRLLGDDTFFLTGTDEHGQKIERSAIAAGIPPQQFADQVSQTFRDLWDRMGITYNDFIRTTDPRHKQGVQKLFKLLQDRGHIYLSTYTGQYCVSDEAYVDGPPGIRCPDCGRVTETVSESNYYFRLSAFQLPLLDLIESGQLAITPESRRNEVLSFLRGNVNIAAIPVSTERSGAPSMAQSHRDMGGNVESPPAADPITSPASVISTEAQIAQERDPRISPESRQTDSQNPAPNINTTDQAHTAAGTPYVPGALKDLSISRTSFHWGVPVPGDEAHVIYVWLDALANYMTALGYGSDDPADIARFERFWPADLHLVGKEIIRFHCIYWPAFLLAAGLPTPRAITAHGWLLFQDSANEATKMSKSKGNIVRTETILDAFGEHYRKELVRLGQPEPPKPDQDLFAADVLRYFLLREIPFGQDGSFSFDAMITRYNADLANGFGNLVSRVLKMISDYSAAEIPPHAEWSKITIQVVDRVQIGFALGAPDPDTFHEIWDTELSRMAKASDVYLQEAFKKLIFSRGAESERVRQALTNEQKIERDVFGVTDATAFLIQQTDAYITNHQPWKLSKDPAPNSRPKLADILYQAAESIRIITALLYPILPYATAKVWSQLGLGSIEQAARNGELEDLQWGGLKPGTKLGPLAPIFPRADVTPDKGLAHIMANMEKKHLPADTEKDMDQPKAESPEPPKDQNQNQPPAPSRLTNETTTASPETPLDPTHPGAPPRTSALPEPDPIAKVAGSASAHTQLPRTPPHTEAYVSGPFTTAASLQPVSAMFGDSTPVSPNAATPNPVSAASPTPTPVPSPTSSPTEGPGFNRATNNPAEGGTALLKAALPNPDSTSPSASITHTEGPGFSRAITRPAEGGTALPKAALPQPADNPQGSPQITIDDFAKVELRVARILVCERIPKADKLLRLEVDLGPEPGMGRRQILSGIAEWYTPEDLIGRKIVVITNLAPRKMRGLESHGMLLAASSGENGKPALATFADADNIEVGARLK